MSLLLISDWDEVNFPSFTVARFLSIPFKLEQIDESVATQSLRGQLVIRYTIVILKAFGKTRQTLGASETKNVTPPKIYRNLEVDED